VIQSRADYFIDNFPRLAVKVFSAESDNAGLNPDMAHCTGQHVLFSLFWNQSTG
jgi:hypothetical protein